MSIPTAQEFIGMNAAGEQKVFKLATVTALFSPSGSPKIKFDGESTASEKKYSYLASYTPTVNDRVLLASVGGTYVILGKIKL